MKSSHTTLSLWHTPPFTESSHHQNKPTPFHTPLTLLTQNSPHNHISMDFWNKAKTFAEEAAKKSQELTKEAAKKSQEFTTSITTSSNTSRIADIVSETAKRSKELAAEASIQIKAEALKRADQIKSLNLLENPAAVLSPGNKAADDEVSPQELDSFGVTEELRDFVQSITLNTFRDFPLADDAEVSDVPTVSNVRQDLTQWQARHATLVLLTVKEISKLRYELCPRFMRERKFWRIYFLLVNSHVAPYEKKYMEEAKLKAAEDEKALREKEATKEAVSKPDGAEPAKPLQKATSSAEQDLDVFLLGDLGDSDEGPDDGDDGFDDDFDKIGESSEDEHAKDPKK